jgi:hypothetical protein
MPPTKRSSPDDQRQRAKGVVLPDQTGDLYRVNADGRSTSKSGGGPDQLEEGALETHVPSEPLRQLLGNATISGLSLRPAATRVR